MQPHGLTLLTPIFPAIFPFCLASKLLTADVLNHPLLMGVSLQPAVLGRQQYQLDKNSKTGKA
jgi:hypothetical protein